MVKVAGEIKKVDVNRHCERNHTLFPSGSVLSCVKKGTELNTSEYEPQNLTDYLIERWVYFDDQTFENHYWEYQN